MLRLLSQKEIKENWEEYRTHIETAFISTEGGNILSSGGTNDIYKDIYGRLMNPFNQVMHLWSEGDEDYIVLTQLQACEFTGKRTLVLFSATRTKDVDKETLSERYFEAYKSISKFAKENKCVGMICYSDLDYFAEMAKQTKDWTNVITRYQFYFPLN
tara:strand:- start:155 stop:628 length:474 start_codon:yes stop_codon:yes gene_type:complete